MLASADPKPRSGLLTSALAGLLLGTLACGPPKLGSGPGGDQTGDDQDTDTSDDQDTDTELTFLSVGDVYEPCDLFMQDCPEDEKCVPYGSGSQTWNSSKCVPVMGSQAPGEPCTWGGIVEATDDCDETSACWHLQEVGGEWTGTCHSFCMGTAAGAICPEGFGCPLSGDPVTNFCIASCDPLLQDCDEGLGCYWYGSFLCSLTGDLAPGEPCQYINDCALGLVCLSAEVLPACEGSECCSSFCDLFDADPQCEAMPGSSCLPFFEEGAALPGYEDIGVCIVELP